MKISTKLIYAPFTLLYCAGLLTHDVLPNLSRIDVRWASYLTLFFIIGVVAILPGVWIVSSFEKKHTKISVGVFLRFALGVSAFFISYRYFWSDWSAFYTSLVISSYVSLLGMMIARKDFRKKQTILRDKNSGNLYEVRAGKAYRLPVNEAANYQANAIPTFEFASDSMNGFGSNTSVCSVSSVSDDFTSNDYKTGMEINPSSGMPMVGGISGLDVHGNSWGTSFNEPSNSYDPGRGY